MPQNVLPVSPLVESCAARVLDVPEEVPEQLYHSLVSTVRAVVQDPVYTSV
jgi:hypothetical protein